MPRGKTTGKTMSKPARQLLFSEALRQRKHPSAEDPPPLPCTRMADDTQGATMDRILQEISAVSRKLEGMDSAMVALTAETRSMRLDIAGFQSQISRLDQLTWCLPVIGASDNRGRAGRGTYIEREQTREPPALRDRGQEALQVYLPLMDIAA
ncbi:hypothetical protein NDU88_006523 [Pleurodeles waltl]|uniref:Uncharacterized protein n=1 Tax=Pleurodeles waltl TaxID=8319 RepID=A0AAV7N3A4_PLEWA|nr:hypothetical protein NDU88_006523 [Pleurodeles waltl]